jgi:hypothetical protein
MCPACIANITLIAAGVASGGGGTAFVFSKFYRSSKQTHSEEKMETKEVEKKKHQVNYRVIPSQKKWEAAVRRTFGGR